MKARKKKRTTYEEALKKLYAGEWDNERFNDAIFEGEIELPQENN